MNKTEANETWFSRGEAEADKGIPSNERVVGIAIVVVSQSSSNNCLLVTY